MQCIPIRDLKDTAAVATMCDESSDPIIITRNGYQSMVIMSAEVFERYHLSSIDERLLRAEEDILAGREKPADDVMRRMREKYGLQRQVLGEG